jgi:hypothetical protein
MDPDRELKTKSACKSIALALLLALLTGLTARGSDTFAFEALPPVRDR